MSKTLSAAMLTHIGQEVSTLAVCWKVTSTGGTVLGFTGHVADLTIDSQLYKANGAFTPSAVTGSATFAVDNSSVDGMLSTDFTADDLRAGKWDFADVEIFLVNYLDLTMGRIRVPGRKLGAVTVGRQMFQAEIRGLMQAYSRTIVELSSPSCRADLGDARCQINLATYTLTGMVTSFTDRRVFFDSARTEANAYFSGSLLTWTGGANNGRQMEVKSYLLAGGAFQLVQPMVSAIALGDTYSSYKGCNKIFDDTVNGCKFFNNVVNFRGEPHIPQSVDVAAASAGLTGGPSAVIGRGRLWG